MSLETNDSLPPLTRAEEALRQRLEQSHSSYTADEIEAVQSVTKQLFPKDFELSLDATEHFRFLTRFCQLELRPPLIRSHRPIVGPIIVIAKKMAWRVLNSLLKDSLHGQRMFNQEVIKSLASAEVRLSEKS